MIDLDTFLANLPIPVDGVVWLLDYITHDDETRQWRFVGVDDIHERDIYADDIAPHRLMIGRTSANTVEPEGAPGGYVVLTDGEDTEGFPLRWRREQEQPWRLDTEADIFELATPFRASRLESIALHALECLR